ncbi:hypothetical protein [Streptomyces sp. ST2-7A]|uniref:hypothetical protein n=1 Tax=Streptomyces sp. ST2-7A TaxID=2907214 RepID=UPI002278E194|nr:hypothetical protein [Streptomyces sp. ST2-7A]
MATLHTTITTALAEGTAPFTDPDGTTWNAPVLAVLALAGAAARAPLANTLTAPLEVETADDQGAIIRIDRWRAEVDASGLVRPMCTEPACSHRPRPGTPRCTGHMSRDDFRAAVQEQGAAAEQAAADQAELIQQADRVLGLSRNEIIRTFATYGIHDGRVRSLARPRPAERIVLPGPPPAPIPEDWGPEARLVETGAQARARRLALEALEPLRRVTGEWQGINLADAIDEADTDDSRAQDELLELNKRTGGDRVHLHVAYEKTADRACELLAQMLAHALVSPAP